MDSFRHLPAGDLTTAVRPGQPLVRITPRPAPAKPIPPVWKPPISMPVPRRETPYWQERGWVQSGNEYAGPYLAADLMFAGKAVRSYSGEVDMVIENTPALRSLLKDHPHWSCFHTQDLRWFRVHTWTGVPDVSAGIIAIEDILKEAYASQHHPTPPTHRKHHERPAGPSLVDHIVNLFT